MANKYFEKAKKALGFEDSDLEARIKDLEFYAYANDGLTPEQEKEYELLVKSKRIQQSDGRKWAAAAAVLAAGLTAFGGIYRVNKITKYEDDDHIVTSRAQNER